MKLDHLTGALYRPDAPHDGNEWTLHYFSQGLYLPNAKWPAAASRYIFICDALITAAPALLVEKWSNDDLLCRKKSIEPELTLPTSVWSPSANRHVPDQDASEADRAKALAFRAQAHANWKRNEQSIDNLWTTMEWFQRQCLDGHMKTYKLEKKPGAAVTETDPSFWTVRNLRELFDYGGTLTDGDDFEKTEHWLFFDKAEFETVLANHGHSHRPLAELDLSLLAPDLQIAVTVALSLELFEVNAPGNREILRRIDDYAKATGRKISLTKSNQMAAVMRWPDESKAAKKRK